MITAFEREILLLLRRLSLADRRRVRVFTKTSNANRPCRFLNGCDGWDNTQRDEEVSKAETTRAGQFGRGRENSNFSERNEYSKHLQLFCRACGGSRRLAPMVEDRQK